jgi:hypothetical protein
MDFILRIVVRLRTLRIHLIRCAGVAASTALFSRLAGLVGSGWVSSHSDRAVTTGSTSNSLPPCGFITAAVDLAMLTPTQRNRQLIADLASKRVAWECNRMDQMVSIALLRFRAPSGVLGS